MKGLFFAVMTFFALPILLMAQPSANPQAHQLEVKVQKLPSNQGEKHYDGSTFAPQVSTHQERDVYNSALAPQVHVNQQEAVPPENFPQQTPPLNENDINTDYEVDSEDLPQQSNQSSESPIDSSDKIDNQSEKNVEQKERTLSIIKPDGVKNNHIGEIISRFEKAGLHVAAMKMVKLSKEQAEQFYQEHHDRPFYHDLVDSMTSGPVVLMVLEGDQAVSKNRELMGATDPKKADRGTIRADFSKDMTQNTVHGSDSPESAHKEILFFFPANDM